MKKLLLLSLALLSANGLLADGCKPGSRKNGYYCNSVGLWVRSLQSANIGGNPKTWGPGNQSPLGPNGINNTSPFID